MKITWKYTVQYRLLRHCSKRWADGKDACLEIRWQANQENALSLSHADADRWFCVFSVMFTCCMPMHVPSRSNIQSCSSVRRSRYGRSKHEGAFQNEHFKETCHLRCVSFTCASSHWGDKWYHNLPLNQLKNRFNNVGISRFDVQVLKDPTDHILGRRNVTWMHCGSHVAGGYGDITVSSTTSTFEVMINLS